MLRSAPSYAPSTVVSSHETQSAAMALSMLAAGKLCIEVTPNSKMAWISEELCIGCGICVKVR